MIPSVTREMGYQVAVYQRGLVIDSQLGDEQLAILASISKGIGD